MSTSAPLRLLPVSHLGFLCDAPKRAVLPADVGRRFALQDVAVHAKETLGDFEDWEAVLEGDLVPTVGAFGDALLADFSSWTEPGMYRLVVEGTEARSPIFPIHDGVLSALPRMLLDFLHSQRCGLFENEWRGPCHLDDGVLSDGGTPVDAVGGWHDAGDTRQWMAHTLNPILGLFELRQRLGWPAGRHWAEAPWPDDLVAETAWGAAFALKMQDPTTGMIWEDVGGGGSARLSSDKWWYENHAGCGGDNSDNRFTDNVRGSGDERRVRRQYNPIVQYTMVTVLLRAAAILEPADADLAARCRTAARRAWDFSRGRVSDDFHRWTAVRSWRALAALALEEAGLEAEDETARGVSGVLELADDATGFFFNDEGRHQPFRGILHSAQPLLALIAFVERHPEHPLTARARDTLETCFSEYVQPLRSESPFGAVPLGLFRDAPRTRDRYRPWKRGLTYRYFLPEDSETRILHGLSGHWMSWAHALAAGGRLLGREDWRHAALDQIHWIVGSNPYGVSLVTGIGFDHPVPHSGFFGARSGGIMVGPRGNAADEPFIDVEGRMEWASTEYWNLALANLLQALAHLVPREVPAERKLGRRERRPHSA